MRARDVVGKRIVAVRQQRIYDEALREPAVALASIELDDGTIIDFWARDRDADLYVVGTKRRKQ